MTRLERDAFPVIGNRPLRSITSADVLAMVRTMEARGALDVSRRIKQHVSQIYRFAIPQGWADQDPAAYLADLLKPKPRDVQATAYPTGEPVPLSCIPKAPFEMGFFILIGRILGCFYQRFACNKSDKQFILVWLLI